MPIKTSEVLAPALAVENPEIKEIMVSATGELVSAVKFITSHTHKEIIELRVKIKTKLKADENEPPYFCSNCSRPVHLPASKHRRFYFKHYKGDGDCKYKTSGMSQTEINRIKYHGLQESEAHKKTKRDIVESLNYDESFSCTKEEKRINGTFDKGRYRIPDVQSKTQNKSFAFEVQLSTTFLDVVIDRQLFYQKENIHLVWILNKFNPLDRSISVEDRLFPNNCNILVVDDETVAKSKSSNQFYIKCWFYKPTIIELDSRAPGWQVIVIPFIELTFVNQMGDTPKCQAFYFDYDAHFLQLKKDNKEKSLDNYRNKFWQIWKNYENESPYTNNDMDSELAELSNDLAKLEIKINFKSKHGKIDTIVNIISSAKEGKPVAWKKGIFVSLAHNILKQKKEYFLIFNEAIDEYGTASILEVEDKTKNWEKALHEARNAFKENRQQYIPSDELLVILEFLFPKVSYRVNEKLKKLNK